MPKCKSQEINECLAIKSAVASFIRTIEPEVVVQLPQVGIRKSHVFNLLGGKLDVPQVERGLLVAEVESFNHLE